MRARHDPAALAARMAPVPFVTQRADRILDRRTSSEIIASMEQLIRCPSALAKRVAFYAGVAEQDRSNRVRADINEALETMSLEQLETAE